MAGPVRRFILPRQNGCEGFPAGAAERRRRNAEQYGVQGAVEVPKRQGEVGLQQGVELEDVRVPVVYVDLHERRGRVGKIAQEERHHHSPWKKGGLVGSTQLNAIVY